MSAQQSWGKMQWAAIDRCDALWHRLKAETRDSYDMPDRSGRDLNKYPQSAEVLAAIEAEEKAKKGESDEWRMPHRSCLGLMDDDHRRATNLG